MNKKIILLALVIFVSTLIVGQVYAANPLVFVNPSAATKNVGENFNVSIQVNPNGNKVCVVTGSLNLSNLSCKAVSVASGLMAQTIPSCSNHNFVLGIPKCATATQNIISVSVRGDVAGSASVGLTNTKVYGANTLMDSSSSNGNYAINAVPVSSSPNPNPSLTSSTQTAQPETQPTVEQSVSPQPAALSGSGTLFAWIRSNLLWLILLIVIVAMIYFLLKNKKKPAKENKQK